MASNPRKKESFISKPYFEGGPKAFQKFVYSNLRYPKEARDNKIEGTVMLRYEINQFGKVVGSKVMHSVGYGCDEEAKRIVRLLQFKMPKNPRKMRIKFSKTIKIKFKLPKEKKVSISYAMTKKKSSSPSPQSYSYTIQF